MIKHVVMWKLKELDDAPRLKGEIEAIAGKIPGLLSIEAGVNINTSPAASDLVLISTHSDKAALEAYQINPIHLELKAIIVAAVTGSTVVDFEV
ncbi:MAG: Dabb family protein [Spirochaetaceae bacterium]